MEISYREFCHLLPKLLKRFSASAFLKGTLFLSLAGILTRIMGFFFRILISRVFQEKGMGIFQLSMPLITLFLGFSSTGIQIAISKYVAQFSVTGDTCKMKRYIWVGLSLGLMISCSIGSILYVFAGEIATYWLHEPLCTPLLKIAAISFPPSTIHACLNGYFIGKKEAKVPAYSQLLEQAVRISTVLLVLWFCKWQQKGYSYALLMWGNVWGEIATCLYSYGAFRKHIALQHCALTKSNQQAPFFQTIEDISRLAVPLSCNRLILGLLQSLEAAQIPRMLQVFGYAGSTALSIYGVLTGMSLSVILFPASIVGSAATMLLPTVSQAKTRRDQATISALVNRSFVWGFSMGFLALVGFFLFGKPIGKILFDSPLAGKFITVLGFICPFLYMSTLFTSMINGLGKPLYAFFIQCFSISIRIMFILFAIPLWGINGYLWGLLISSIFSAGCNYMVVKNLTK